MKDSNQLFYFYEKFGLCPWITILVTFLSLFDTGMTKNIRAHPCDIWFYSLYTREYQISTFMYYISL